MGISFIFSGSLMLSISTEGELDLRYDIKS